MSESVTVRGLLHSDSGTGVQRKSVIVRSFLYVPVGTLPVGLKGLERAWKEFRVLSVFTSVLTLCKVERRRTGKPDPCSHTRGDPFPVSQG